MDSGGASFASSGFRFRFSAALAERNSSTASSSSFWFRMSSANLSKASLGSSATPALYRVPALVYGLPDARAAARVIERLALGEYAGRRAG